LLTKVVKKVGKGMAFYQTMMYNFRDT